MLDALVRILSRHYGSPRLARTCYTGAALLLMTTGCISPVPPAASAPSQPATNGDSLAALASELLRAGDTAAAIAAYRQTIASDPQHNAAGALITLLYDVGRTAESPELGERYRRHGPRNPRALFRYGWALGYLWENARADSVFRELIALDRGGIYEAWGNGELAYLARARGDLDGATHYMELARRARPDDAISRIGRATMLLDAGRARDALTILTAEVAADSLARGYGALPAMLLLASAYLQTGDTAAARSAIERLRPRVGQLSAARQLQFYAVAGDVAAASRLADRTRAISLYGSPDPGDYLLARLRGVPEYEALLSRSRAEINARRRTIGLQELQ